MRNFFGALLLACLCLTAVGCAPMRTQAEIASLDYGPYPENYKELVIQYMSKRFADPYSALYEFQGEPHSWYEHMGSFVFNNHDYWGWGGVVYVNAKNGYGAYTGAQPHRYIIRNGKVILIF